MRPQVDILYFQGCPNWQQTRALVERLSLELQINVDLHLVEVLDHEAAVSSRFLGSPSVRVNGADVEPGADARHDFVYACRVYRSERGLTGQPDEAWIRAALAREPS
jgi:hypothetical protein